MEFSFGEKTVYYNVSKHNMLGVLECSRHHVKPLKEILERSILSPIGKPRLNELLQKNKPRDLIIIVSDITRSIADYDKILSFLVAEIIDAGVDEKNIEFMVALGTHRKHTAEENKFLFGDLVSNFKFSFHDCHNDLIAIGKTSTGLDVQVNRRVRAADFVIATGRINFHYLAGFSGGRKSILPGIASYETIRNNHCKLKREGVSLGKIESNIIAQEMDEAAQLFGVDYLVNVIETSDKRVANAFCGDTVNAHEKGIEHFKAEHMSKIKRQADCVIVSAGGYPKDRTFFNGHKVLNNAVSAVRKGGSVILLAECIDGVGNPEFERYMLDNNLEELLRYPEAKIEVGGHRAFQTSRLLQDYKVYVISELDSALLSQMNFTPVKDIDGALSQVKKDHGQDLKIYIVPDGQSVLATVNGRC
jgi:nickel-dependent lactate racemase